MNDIWLIFLNQLFHSEIARQGINEVVDSLLECHARNGATVEGSNTRFVDYRRAGIGKILTVRLVGAINEYRIVFIPIKPLQQKMKAARRSAVDVTVMNVHNPFH